jgi:hypothetical protein
MMRPALRIGVAVMLFLAPTAIATAQDALKPADVEKFMGTWTLNLDSPQGSFAMNFALTEKEGKVTGELTSDIAPPQEVTDISKSGDDLVLKYAGNFQGNSFDAKITMTPSGDNAVNLVFDVNNGQFMMNGTGIKK